MIRRSLLFLAFLTPLMAGAQILVGLGYQQGYFSMPNADIPVDRFNNRGFLTRRSNHFHLPGGEIYAVSIRHNRILAELNMNTRRARISAESYSGNVLNRRDTRFAMQAFSLGGGYAVVDNETFALYPCAAVDVGWMRLSTRTGPKETLGQQPYATIRREPMVALSAYLKMVFRNNREAITSVSLSPYFHFPLRDFDFVYLNQILNTADWFQDGYSLPARPWNVGVILNVDLDLLRFLQ